MALQKLAILLITTAIIVNSQSVEDISDNSEEVVEVEKSVIEFEFFLKEEKLPLIIYHLYDSRADEFGITVENLIQVTGLKNNEFGIDQTIALLQKFNIPASRAFTVDGLESLLKGMGIQFRDFFNAVNNRLQIRSETLSPVYKALNIDELKFFQAIVYKQYIYHTLREGIYDDEHVNNALSLVGKTRSEVFQAAKNVFLERISQEKISTVFEQLQVQGFNPNVHEKFWKALGITTRDVYQIEKLRQLIESIIGEFNSEQTIAVAVGPKDVAIHKNVYQQYSTKIDGDIINVKIKDLGVDVDESYKKDIGNNMILLHVKTPLVEFVDLTKFYNVTTNCSYVTITDGVAKVEEIEVVAKEDLLEGSKKDNAIFKLGSPLFCQNQLFGLAEEETDEVIVFRKFFDDDPNSSANLQVSFVLLLAALLFLQ